MRRLVPLDLPAGPEFVDALRRAWDDGDAVLPVDPRLPRPAIEALLRAMRVDEPVEDGDALVVATSGTTGDPKGVVYSHRSTVLHTMACCMVDGGAMSEKEVTLPAVPMFHVNAWGMPYSCTMTGGP